MTSNDYVRALYRLALGREPDDAGLRYWVDFIQQSGDSTEVLAQILDSEEFRQRNTKLQFRSHAARAAVLAGLIDPNCGLTIVDVGAQRLSYQEHMYQPLLDSGVPCHIIGFDPLAERLRERAEQEKNYDVTLLPYAIGDGQSRPFYINNVDATSSFYPLNPDLNCHFGDLSSLKTISTQQIATHRLDDVLSCEKVDLLKLDIQGFELCAMKSSPKTLARTAVIHCEVLFAPIYLDQPVFSQVESFLASSGFQFVDFVNPVHLPLIVASGKTYPDTLIFADALFLRVDPSNPEMTIAQALIAILVYGKYGLAEWLLQQCDRVNGTHLADTISSV